MKVLAITTYNRLRFLKQLIGSFKKTISDTDWMVLIADDGSTDGTIEYIEKETHPDIPINLIKNSRQGVHHQFNTIVRKLEEIDYNYCFKCDDDIEFLKRGWEDLYINAIKKSGYDHLCHFDPTWRPEKNLNKPIVNDDLIGSCRAKDVQGAFFTLTPNVVKKVGYMDVKNFGFRGVGHIDYTIRCCRAGFNVINSPFDVRESSRFITHQRKTYRSAMNQHVQNALESDQDIKIKYQLINDSTRLYIPYFQNAPKLNESLETQLLIKRLEILEKEKQWYEQTYGHQPRWFIRIGKLLQAIKRIFI